MRTDNRCLAKRTAAAAVFAAAMVWSFCPAPVQAASETIPRGVYIGNIDVGGMTRTEAESALEEYADSLQDTTFTLTTGQGSMQLSAEEMGLGIETADAVEEALAMGRTGSLIDRFKEEKALESGDFHIDLPLTLNRQDTAERIYENRKELGTEAEDNRIIRENGSFTFVEGQRGEEVDVVQSVYAIESFLEDWQEGTDSVIALITKEVEPRGSQEELSRITDVLGTFSTNFGSSSYQRATNVKNGCSKINGTILYPGEEFSVYETVSPFTQENGYELAGSYANGTTVESFGGGICQVSTTLYNAVIRAELEVTQRYNHSMAVAYVQPSEDAAIAGTYKDFRFINNQDVPIYIQGYCEGGVITFNIYGQETRPANREVTFESEVLETIEPETQIVTSSSNGLGYIETTQGSHTGYEAQLWKIVTVDGVQESREIFNRSSYKASPRIITVGTRGASKEAVSAIESAAGSGELSKVQAAVSAASSGDESQDKEENTEQEEEQEKEDKKGKKKAEETEEDPEEEEEDEEDEEEDDEDLIDDSSDDEEMGEE